MRQCNQPSHQAVNQSSDQQIVNRARDSHFFSVCSVRSSSFGWFWQYSSVSVGWNSTEYSLLLLNRCRKDIPSAHLQSVSKIFGSFTARQPAARYRRRRRRWKASCEIFTTTFACTQHYKYSPIYNTQSSVRNTKIIFHLFFLFVVIFFYKTKKILQLLISISHHFSTLFFVFFHLRLL